MILVSIDTLRADHVGAYGSEVAHTPVIDQLATEGVRFETALSPAPLTLPSHTTLLTGLDPPEHGVRHNAIFRLADDVPTLAQTLSEQGFETGAFVGAFVLARQFGLDRGFDRYDDRTRQSSSRRGLRGFAERPAGDVVDAALEWIESAGDRFFLFVHFYDPHADYAPPQGFAVSFSNPYVGEIAYSDSQLGRLLQGIRARWPDDEDGGRTLIVVTSDHGDSLGDHGEATHSHFVYESTQRVPLVMRGPGLPAGRVVQGPVALRDIAPTILELVGKGSLPGATGSSLIPLLSRGESDQAVYMEALAPQIDWGMSPLLAIRDARFKYIRAPRPELYDLTVDPEELQNLAADEPARVEALDRALAARVAVARSIEPNMAVDDAERRQLESLGYVVPDTAEVATRGALGVVGGIDPKDGQAMIRAVNRADRLVAQGRAKEALELLEKFDGSPSSIYMTMRSAAALQAGDAAESERLARMVVQKEPSRAAAHSRLAAALLEQGRVAEAAQAYSTLVEVSPGTGAPEAALGLLAEAQGDWEGALAHYQRAAKASDPDPRAAWRTAALLLERPDRAEEADRAIRALSPELMSRPEVVLRLVRAERRAGRYAEARKRAEAALAKNDGLLEIAAERASILEASGEVEAARLERERLIAIVRAEEARGNQRIDWRIKLLWAELAAALGLMEEAEAVLGPLQVPGPALALAPLRVEQAAAAIGNP